MGLEQEYAQAMRKVLEVSIPHGGLRTNFDGVVTVVTFPSPSHTVGLELIYHNKYDVRRLAMVSIPHGGLRTSNHHIN